MAGIILWTVSALGFSWLILKIYNYSSLRASLRGVPLKTLLISPVSVIGILGQTTIPFIVRGRTSCFAAKWREFEAEGWNLFAFTSLFLRNQATVWVADKNIIKEIASQRSKFPKPVKAYFLLKLYGESILVTEGEEWKRHKKISQSAFSEKNTRLVWSAVDGILSELFDDIWEVKDEVVVKDTLSLCHQFALMVLGVAAFGKEMHWQAISEVPEGHSMDLSQALHLVSSNPVIVYGMPRWMMGMSEHLRKIRTAAGELHKYTTELIAEKSATFDSERQNTEQWDLLSNLVAASQDLASETAGARLSTSELRGNIIIYLLAGHETTANTLTNCLNLLALFPEEQEKLYAHIKAVIGDGQATYKDIARLTRVQAVMNESLRLFAPIQLIPKRTEEDAFFNVSAADPKSEAKRQVLIPAGTTIMLHTPGLHYNPRYWQDPYAFKPGRFLGDWDRDAFLPFSGGPRACAGKRFAEVEIMATLTFLILKYTLHLMPEVEEGLVGLSMKDKIEKVLKITQKLTLTPPTGLHLVFKRRKTP